MTNPFSTRYTRPGRIEPLDDAGSPVNVDAMLELLRRVGGAAAIVGPHGSGKSTLLVRLADAIEARGERAVRLRLRHWWDAWRVIPAIRSAGTGSVICIDGWECLAVAARGVVRLAAAAARCRLVVTAHRDGRMPVLARCGTSAALLDSILKRLPGWSAWYGTTIVATDVATAFEQERGDIREAIFALYDVFELRSRRVEPQRS